MSVVNHKGGFFATMRIQQNSRSEALCMLEKPFLKKAENFALQITDFFINKPPILNRDLGGQLRIRPFGADLSDGYREDDYLFTPQNCYTVCEYAVQLQEFFNKFSFLFWKYGVANAIGTTNAQDNLFIETAEDIAHTGVNYVQKNIVPNIINPEEAPTVDEGYIGLPKICSCSLRSDLKIQIKLEPIFCANFFIECMDNFRTRLGFPQYLFTISTLLGDDIVAPARLYAAEGVFIEEVDDRLAPDNAITFFSDYSIRELDDRLSLDVVCTFPASRKISVIDGKETHEYLLARFDLSNYKRFESVSYQDNERMHDGTQITETYQAGIENLTRGNPDYESNLLLPGSVHQVHLMLYTRYLERGKIERVKTDMQDGFWHTRLLFSKKV